MKTADPEDFDVALSDYEDAKKRLRLAQNQVKATQESLDRAQVALCKAKDTEDAAKTLVCEARVMLDRFVKP